MIKDLYDFKGMLQMVNDGEIAKDSPLGLLGMLNSENAADRIYALERLSGRPDKVKVTDSKGRQETRDLHQVLRQEYDKGYYGWWIAHKYGIKVRS
ncbi:hypothetical protein KAR91_34725 [Candidatus Pacearchaeota archaeon]|nr:hypothetical protein [Candidatus Pacearchaeota archaeon]